MASHTSCPNAIGVGPIAQTSFNACTPVVVTCVVLQLEVGAATVAAGPRGDQHRYGLSGACRIHLL
jgi:hypothetical protein